MDIESQMKNIKRKDKALNTNYNKKNLTDDQIDKLITDNYNLDFLDLGTNNAAGEKGGGGAGGSNQNLDKMADKFKNARQRLKNANALNKTANREKFARGSRQSGFYNRGDRQSSTSGTGNRKDLAVANAPSENNSGSGGFGDR